MEKIYSIKMRASEGASHENGGKHISGAERIVPKNELKKVMNDLVDRAFNHPKGVCDFLNLSFLELKEDALKKIPSLAISTVKVSDYKVGRKKAVKIMEKSGIEITKAKKIMKILENVGPLKGAIIIDINTLERLDDPIKKGLRVTSMDWEDSIKNELLEKLNKHNLGNVHVQEAVCLASKTLSAPGIICELCWSDDPDYTAGYVATSEFGYVRITELKPFNEEIGGRLFCFDSSKASFKECSDYLIKQAVLVNELPLINDTFKE